MGVKFFHRLNESYQNPSGFWHLQERKKNYHKRIIMEFHQNNSGYCFTQIKLVLARYSTIRIYKKTLFKKNQTSHLQSTAIRASNAQFFLAKQLPHTTLEAKKHGQGQTTKSSQDNIIAILTL